MTERDTICAISTPPGIGGIAVIRISGPRAIPILHDIWRGKDPTEWTSHTAHLGDIIDPTDGTVLDQAVATIYRAPRSFTTDDVIELSVHGSTYIQQQLLRILIDRGARLAEPGEFTRRAYVAGRIDLPEAEAVADLISARSRAAHRLAVTQLKGTYSRRINQLRDRLIELAALLELELDFSEEDVEFASRTRLRELALDIDNLVSRLADSFATGQAIRDGIPVAIIGAPNAGKSTLLNLLLDDDRAIVSDVPGTTRDVIHGTTLIQGTLFRFIDTAGIHDTDDTVERIGISRTVDNIRRARILLWLVDPTQPLPDLTSGIARTILDNVHPETKIITVSTKIDLCNPQQINDLQNHLKKFAHVHLNYSSLIPSTLADIHTTICESVDCNLSDDIIITNSRHYEELTQAHASLSLLLQGLDNQIPGDLLAQHLRQAIHHLSSLTGPLTTPTLLQTIFSRFCIGK